MFDYQRVNANKPIWQAESNRKPDRGGSLIASGRFLDKKWPSRHSTSVVTLWGYSPYASIMGKVQVIPKFSKSWETNVNHSHSFSLEFPEFSRVFPGFNPITGPGSRVGHLFALHFKVTRGDASTSWAGYPLVNGWHNMGRCTIVNGKPHHLYIYVYICHIRGIWTYIRGSWGWTFEVPNIHLLTYCASCRRLD